jgi:hypothetical protein
VCGEEVLVIEGVGERGSVQRRQGGAAATTEATAAETVAAWGGKERGTDVAAAKPVPAVVVESSA